MDVKKLLGAVVVLILAALGYTQLPETDSESGDQTTQESSSNSGTSSDSSSGSSGSSERGSSSGESTTDGTGKADPPNTDPPPEDKETIEGPVIVDGPDGPQDIRPTLDRIARGESHSHRNDGSVFQNREGLLPKHPRGYYREYVVPTPGERGPGAQRMVIGEKGETYYTPDHYNSFQRVDDR